MSMLRGAMGISVLLVALTVASAQDARNPPLPHQSSKDSIALPQPTGPYRVGRRTIPLVDAGRKESFTEAPDDLCEFVVTLHYPADVSADVATSPYAGKTFAAAIAEAYRKPASHVDRVESHAVENAPAARRDGGFPVVVFSPGFQTNPLFYTATLEDLASQGFIVASTCHTYSTEMTIFPDGRAVRSNDAGTRFSATSATRTCLRKRWSHIAMRSVRCGSPTCAFVADWLTKLNADPGHAGTLDVHKLGIFGHSFGGATAAAAVARDERFLAGMNLDGSDFSTTDGNRIRDKFLWLCSEPPELRANELMPRIGTGDAKAKEIAAPSVNQKKAPAPPSQRFVLRGEAGQTPPANLANRRPTNYSGLHAPADRVWTIRGARHNTFISDEPLLESPSRLARSVAGGNLETIDAQRAVEIVNAIVSGFFRQQLCGDDVPLIDDPTAVFPEVIRGKAKAAASPD